LNIFEQFSSALGHRRFSTHPDISQYTPPFFPLPRSGKLVEDVLGRLLERQTMAQVLAAPAAAPDFSLHVTPDQKLSLSELRGRPVVLAFYPADWSPVCGDQMGLYNEILSDFHKFNAELLGISVDGAWCHEAFSKDRHLHFPLLADFEPKGAVARQYGAYREADGFCERALFVIDRQGKIAWSYCSPVAVNPGADGILEALEGLPK
jgi:peroxiredoxin